MVYLSYNILISKILWSILLFLTGSINNCITELHTDTISCTVKFHNAYFFGSNPNNDLKIVDPFFSLDSTYISNKVTDYLSDAKPKFIKEMVKKDFIHYYMGLYYGRFWSSSLLKDFSIDLSLFYPHQDIYFPAYKDSKYFGTEIVEPFYDTMMISDTLKSLKNLIGLDNYLLLFTFCHEISHFVDFMNLYKQKKDFSWIKKNRLTESQVDSCASAFLIKNYIEIDSIFTH